jgi:hypothetical protein
VVIAWIYVCRKISFVKNDPKFVESRNLKNYIQRDFNQDLYNALFNLNWEINDPNMLWENFQITLNYVADIHAPLQSRKVRNRTVADRCNYEKYELPRLSQEESY